MTLPSFISNQQWAKPNPWRDWQRLLIGFFIMLAVAFGLYGWSAWYFGDIVNSAAGQAAGVPQVDKKLLNQVLDAIARRELDHQTNVDSPKTYPDPSR